jgi:hypothetical protein
MRQYTKAFIQSLLDKYMEGTTTLEEEDILHQYFTRSDVPAEWEDYRLLFAEIDSMRPAEKPQSRWWPWSIAAAVVAALVVFVATQMLPENRPKSDVIVQVTEERNTRQPLPQPLPRMEGSSYTQDKDSVGKSREELSAPLPSGERLPCIPKRRLRKPQPTMTDYDKAYALMAEAAKEQQQAAQEMEQAQQEILHTQVTAAGYVAIQQEDGTIIYTNEPKEYFAYEE